MDIEQVVTSRYAAAARTKEQSLCCPVSYDPKLLEAIPREVLERDYGCGDPTAHLREGETVLDLGSGSGKICFIASQVVGPRGRVIGVDMNPEMLDLARRAADEPWRTVEGIEFRSITAIAYKGKEGPCLDQKHAVIYRGPFREVIDDDGHVLRRGVRTAVCEKTFQIFSRPPYRAHLELVPPRVLVPLEASPSFPCGPGTLRRDPRETKGLDYRVTTETAPACTPKDGKNGGCC